MPHLLDIQTEAFKALLKPEGGERPDVGLERVFRDLFPITDVNQNYTLDFVSYAVGDPKYSVEECIERDMTYSAPLKATLRLVVLEEVTPGTTRPKNIIEKEVYLGELPLLTPLGTFVINGCGSVRLPTSRTRAICCPASGGGGTRSAWATSVTTACTISTCRGGDWA